jgi:hypothetical protein
LPLYCAPRLLQHPSARSYAGRHVRCRASLFRSYWLFSCGLDMPHLQWNPKFPYDFHNSSTLNYTRSQMNPVHILAVYSFEMNFNIIVASMPISHRSCVCHLLYPTHLIRVHWVTPVQFHEAHNLLSSTYNSLFPPVTS